MLCTTARAHTPNARRPQRNPNSVLNTHHVILDQYYASGLGFSIARLGLMFSGLHAELRCREPVGTSQTCQRLHHTCLHEWRFATTVDETTSSTSDAVWWIIVVCFCVFRKEIRNYFAIKSTFKGTYRHLLHSSDDEIRAALAGIRWPLFLLKTSDVVGLL